MLRCCTNRVCELQLACIWPEVWICLYLAMHVSGFFCCRPFYDVEISTLALKLQEAQGWFLDITSACVEKCIPISSFREVFFLFCYTLAVVSLPLLGSGYIRWNRKRVCILPISLAKERNPVTIRCFN